MKQILIFGSGSIGNHMAYACRKLKHNVCVTDVDNLALKRMKNKIFPKRYKYWDKKISLIKYHDVFKIKNKLDLIIIGTPPKTHLSLYEQCKNKLNFNKILIEKPLTYYANKNLKKFEKNTNQKNIFCGYNHSVSKSFKYFLSTLKKKIIKLKI